MRGLASLHRHFALTMVAVGAPRVAALRPWSPQSFSAAAMSPDGTVLVAYTRSARTAMVYATRGAEGSDGDDLGAAEEGEIVRTATLDDVLAFSFLAHRQPLLATAERGAFVMRRLVAARAAAAEDGDARPLRLAALDARAGAQTVHMACCELRLPWEEIFGEDVAVDDQGAAVYADERRAGEAVLVVNGALVARVRIVDEPNSEPRLERVGQVLDMRRRAAVFDRLDEVNTRYRPAVSAEDALASSKRKEQGIRLTAHAHSIVFALTDEGDVLAYAADRRLMLVVTTADELGDEAARVTAMAVSADAMSLVLVAPDRWHLLDLQAFHEERVVPNRIERGINVLRPKLAASKRHAGAHGWFEETHSGAVAAADLDFSAADVNGLGTTARPERTAPRPSRNRAKGNNP